MCPSTRMETATGKLLLFSPVESSGVSALLGTHKTQQNAQKENCCGFRVRTICTSTAVCQCVIGRNTHNGGFKGPDPEASLVPFHDLREILSKQARFENTSGEGRTHRPLMLKTPIGQVRSLWSRKRWHPRSAHSVDWD